jgi:RNA polymerase sigma-70 factor (ECF subfamily)
VDQSLVERAQRGDRDAFASLLASVGDSLYALAYRILRDPHLAQDAFQEATIAAWRQMPNLHDSARFEAWISRILVHACYAESRKRTRWTTHVRVLGPDDDRRPHEAGTSIDDRDELERGFRALPVDQRAVFILHHHVGLPLVEIADLLGIPAGTARSRLHYSTQALRRALSVDSAPAAEPVA